MSEPMIPGEILPADGDHGGYVIDARERMQKARDLVAMAVSGMRRRGQCRQRENEKREPEHGWVSCERRMTDFSEWVRAR